MSLCFCICWWRLRVESKGKSFLCSMLFPFTVLVTIEMTLLGKGKYSQPCVSRYAWHFPAFSLHGSYTWPWVEEGGGGVRRREGVVCGPPPQCLLCTDASLAFSFLLAWVLFSLHHSPALYHIEWMLRVLTNWLQKLWFGAPMSSGIIFTPYLMIAWNWAVAVLCSVLGFGGITNEYCVVPFLERLIT